jgi:hypothetical protein
VKRKRAARRKARRRAQRAASSRRVELAADVADHLEIELDPAFVGEAFERALEDVAATRPALRVLAGGKKR